MAQLSYVHRFEPGEALAATPLLLLHGTGGDENDLLPVGRMVAPGAALLSPRGDVLERGMPRFFRRFAEGVFDQDDVRRRAGALADFVTDTRKAYGIAAPIALGYSNGANIAAAVLLLRPGVLAGAILWRAMMPLTAPQPTSLSGTPVLMVSGARDPIAAPAEADRLQGCARSRRRGGRASRPPGEARAVAGRRLDRAGVAAAAEVHRGCRRGGRATNFLKLGCAQLREPPTPTRWCRAASR
jgi:phospholipase/carboxylesterase